MGRKIQAQGLARIVVYLREVQEEYQWLLLSPERCKVRDVLESTLIPCSPLSSVVEDTARHQTRLL